MAIDAPSALRAVLAESRRGAPCYFAPASFIAGLSLVVLLVAAPGARAVSIVLDQSLVSGPGLNARNTSPMGQSFTAGIDGLLAEVWYVSFGSSSQNGTVEIREGGPGGTILGLGTTPFDTTVEESYAPNPTFVWMSIDVTSLGVNVTQGEQYTFAMPTFSGGAVYVDATAGYAGGTYHESGVPIVDEDMYFRTYVQVPEPSTVLLATIGLVGLAACGRRRWKPKAA